MKYKQDNPISVKSALWGRYCEAERPARLFVAAQYLSQRALFLVMDTAGFLPAFKAKECNMAVRKRVIYGENNKKSKNWYIFFDYPPGVERVFSAGPDLGEARKLEGKIKTLVKCRQNGSYSEDVLVWLGRIPAGLRSRLAKWDLIEGAQAGAAVSLQEHVMEWNSVLRASGVSQKQADLMRCRVLRVFEHAGFYYWSDISESKVQTTIDCLHKMTRKKNQKTGEIEAIEQQKAVSSFSKLHYVRAVKQFSKWMKADNRAAKNPLENLTIKGAAVENRRRALSVAEITYLLEYTQEAGPLRGL